MLIIALDPLSDAVGYNIEASMFRASRRPQSQSQARARRRPLSGGSIKSIDLLKASEWSARFAYPWDNLIFGIAVLHR